MLLFWKGSWITIDLPSYMDPSWGLQEQTQAAYGLAAGKSWDAIEVEIFSTIFGKEHGRPENKEK